MVQSPAVLITGCPNHKFLWWPGWPIDGIEPSGPDHGLPIPQILMPARLAIDGVEPSGSDHRLPILKIPMLARLNYGWCTVEPSGSDHTLPLPQVPLLARLAYRWCRAQRFGSRAAHTTNSCDGQAGLQMVQSPAVLITGCPYHKLMELITVAIIIKAGGVCPISNTIISRDIGLQLQLGYCHPTGLQKVVVMYINGQALLKIF